MAKQHNRWIFAFGVLVGAAVTATMAWKSRRRSKVGELRRPITQLIAGEESKRTLFEPLTQSFIQVRDARQEGGERAAPRREIELFLQRRRSVQEGMNSVLKVPPPGGLGAGISYGDSLLHFQEYTAVYFYLVAPPSIGVQPHADLLYMTSSNAACKGCEALLSFFADEQYRAAFRIWDWAHPDMAGGGKFVKNYTYEELSDYLIPYRFPLESGGELDTVCLYVVNVTRQISGSSFQNEVYLQNHLTGTRDLKWSYAFDWPDKATATEFWWGPIFETFPLPGAQYSLQNPVGFDQALVVQDGIQYQLTAQDSTLTLPTANGLQEVYRSVGTNSGLVCAS
jgi:hypothetical protein